MSFKKGVAPVFDRKWWDKNRPMALGGCGVGKALEGWVKNCIKSPDTFKTRDEFEAALTTCGLLKVALAKAKGKCTKDKDSTECVQKYEKIRSDYEGDVTDRYNKNVESYKKDRTELRDYMKNADKEMKAHLKECQKWAKYVENCELEIIEDYETNYGVNASKIYGDAGKGKNVLDGKVKEAEKDFKEYGDFMVSRRVAKYDAASYGLSKEDADKHSGIFDEAKRLFDSCTNLDKEISELSSSAEQSHLSVVKLYSQSGKRSVEDVVAEVQAMAKQAAKLTEELSAKVTRGVDTITNNTKIVEGLVKMPNSKEMMKKIVSKFDADEELVKTAFGTVDNYCNKNLKRVPKALENDKAVKKQVDALKMAHLRALGLKDKYYKAHKEIMDEAAKAK